MSSNCANRCLAVGLVLSIVLSVAISQSFTSDSLFPKFHPRPKQNWVNDPNGPFYLNGVYHLFTQYNPWSAQWTNLSWSHMVSYDLVFWIELPTPILPDMPYDVGGCWSGSATVLQDGNVALAYTCLDVNGTERQCLAFPKDRSDKFLQEWVKYEGNPVIDSPPPGGNVGEFRDDSTAWVQDGQYIMMVGSGVNGTGQAWLYTSTDFTNWTSQHSLFGDYSTGMFECPDFFPLQDFENPSSDTPYAFKASCGIDVYWIGNYDPQAVQFTPNGYVLGYQVLDHGRFYASKRFYDPVGKRQVLYSWSNELLANTSFMAWQGAITLPRSLGYNAQFNMMTQEPLSDLQALRVAVSHYSDSFSIAPGGYANCSNRSWTSAQFEVLAQIDLTDACDDGCSAGFSFFTNAYGNQSTEFYISWNEPIGPIYNQTILNNYNQQLIDNVSLSTSHSRPQLIKECQQLCFQNSDCLTWTIEFNSSLSAVAERQKRPLGRSESLHSAWSRPEHRGHAGSFDYLDQPAPNPWCFLFNLDPLNQSSVLLIWGHGDSASGANFNSPYPVLVADNLHAGAGDISAFMAVVPVDPEQPKSTFEMRAFVDHSIVEVFVDSLAVITSRVYPDASSNQWGFFVNSASQNVSLQVDAWKMLDAVA